MYVAFWSRTRRTFDSPPKPIDQLIVEMAGQGDAATVTRNQALSVPAVRRGRNMLCAISTMPLEQVGPTNVVLPSPLLGQIDLDVPNVVTLAQTVEDLVFSGIAWWEVTAKGYDGYPLAARHLDVASVSVDPPEGRGAAPLPSGTDPREGVVYVDGKPVGGSRVIRFDSPNPAVLDHAGREIRRAVLLDKAAGMYADDPRPLDYFRPTEGADPLEDDEITTFLGRWRSARKRRSTAYIPASVEYHTVDTPSPQQLQLAELQKQASLDIANALGIDPEDLGISTTSRSYSNDVDRRRNRLNDVLAPYMRAITDRLSMGDVTRRGFKVRFNTTEYLQPNPTDRWGVYATAKGLEAMTLDEIRQAEGLPPLADPEPAPVPDPEPATVVDASRPAQHTYDSAPGLTFADVPLSTFTVDREGRVIEGLALPYNRVASQGVRFERGALQWAADSPGRVKLLRDHDTRQPLGKAIQLRDTPKGLLVRFKVAKGTAGDEALELADDGVLDGLSVGVDFDAARDTVPDPKSKGVVLVRRADLREVSLTAMPSFDDARVTTVAASRATGGPTMADTPTAVEAPEAPAPVPTPAGVTLSADQLVQIFAEHRAAASAAPEGPTPVNPARTVTLSNVTEEAPYRFDRGGNLTAGSHDFSTDLVAWSKGDSQAGERAHTFMRAQFDVDRADVPALNPNRQRPDMYVDQREFQFPVWDAINKGTLADSTPFVLPKFNTASGLVGTHTEGTEPTPGTFTATSQTITPGAVSGKVEITREAWDQGGNPQLSGLIWRQMTRAYYEALEARAIAVLDAATPTAIALTAGGGTTGQTLAAELVQAFASLQFVRGGFSMDHLFAQIDLYRALVGARDTTGRPIYPALGPSNAHGTVASRWGAVDVNGVVALPAWALAATGSVVASSYLFDSNSVHGWATAPQQLKFEYRVAYVDLAIWGYAAAAITDINGVREITYDPVA